MQLIAHLHRCRCRCSAPSKAEKSKAPRGKRGYELSVLGELVDDLADQPTPDKGAKADQSRSQQRKRAGLRSRKLRIAESQVPNAFLELTVKRGDILHRCSGHSASVEELSSDGSRQLKLLGTSVLAYQRPCNVASERTVEEDAGVAGELIARALDDEAGSAAREYSTTSKAARDQRAGLEADKSQSPTRRSHNVVELMQVGRL